MHWHDLDAKQATATASPGGHMAWRRWSKEVRRRPHSHPAVIDPRQPARPPCATHHSIENARAAQARSRWPPWGHAASQRPPPLGHNREGEHVPLQLRVDRGVPVRRGARRRPAAAALSHRRSTDLVNVVALPLQQARCSRLVALGLSKARRGRPCRWRRRSGACSPRAAEAIALPSCSPPLARLAVETASSSPPPASPSSSSPSSSTRLRCRHALA
jgi:hypothetical protein